MHKIRINGTIFVPLSAVKFMLRKARKQDADFCADMGFGIEETANHIIDNMVRYVFREELQEAKDDAEREAIMEMPGDFVVHRGGRKEGIEFFGGWIDYESKKYRVTSGDDALVFSYESKAEEVAAALGEGWSVTDVSKEYHEHIKRLIDAITGYGTDLGDEEDEDGDDEDRAD